MLLTSMSDFYSWRVNGWNDKIFSALKDNPRHQCLILTKRLELCNYNVESENIWIGVTITTKKEIDRIKILKEKCKAKKYFITFEPLFDDLGKVDLKGVNFIFIRSETRQRRGKIIPKS